MADQENFPDIYIDESVAPGGVGSLADPHSDFSEINWTTGGDNSIFDWYAGAEDASITINHKKGEAWRERFNVVGDGTATYPIILQAYGAGDNPLILGSEEVIGVAGDWANVVGNIWKRALVTECKVVVFDTTHFGAEAVVASTPAAQYEWDWVANELFVFSVGNPTGYYTSIEASQRAYCIAHSGGARNYITIDGVDCKGAGTYNIFYPTGSLNGEIKNLTSSYSAQTGILFQSANGTFDIDNVTTEYTGTNGIGTRDQTAGTIQNCDSSYYACVGGENHALDIHGSSNLLIEYNHFHHINPGGTGEGIGGDRYNNCIIQYNEVNNYYMVGIDLAGATGEECYENIVRYNLVHDGDTTQGAAIQCNSNVAYDNGSYDNEIYYNIIYNDKRGIFFAGDVRGNKAYNNVIYNMSSEGINLYDNGKKPSNNLIKNNIVHTCAGKLIYASTDLFEAPNNNISDYNCFYDADFTNKFGYEGNQSTLADFRTASGQDAHSIASNPLFVDFANYDFHLRAGSPCINAGMGVGLIEDYDGDPVGAFPDIGAFERGYNVEVVYLKKVYLGPVYSEIELPELKWLKGSPPTWSVSSNKEIEVAKMMDKSRRINFFGVKREWRIGFGYLSKSQLDVLRDLNALKQVLHFQNNNEDTTWYNVYISSFRHEPERMDIRQLERYKIEMTLKEV